MGKLVPKLELCLKCEHCVGHNKEISYPYYLCALVQSGAQSKNGNEWTIAKIYKNQNCLNRQVKIRKRFRIPENCPYILEHLYANETEPKNL